MQQVWRETQMKTSENTLPITQNNRLKGRKQKLKKRLCKCYNIQEKYSYKATAATATFFNEKEKKDTSEKTSD